MAETPILDALHEAIIATGSGCGFDEADEVLRLALPWDLPAERLEAMARAMVVQTATHYGDDLPVNPDLRLTKELALAAYRADPIMRELYPEKFDGPE